MLPPFSLGKIRQKTKRLVLSRKKSHDLTLLVWFFYCTAPQSQWFLSTCVFHTLFQDLAQVCHGCGLASCRRQLLTEPPRRQDGSDCKYLVCAGSYHAVLSEENIPAFSIRRPSLLWDEIHHISLLCAIREQSKNAGGELSTETTELTLFRLQRGSLTTTTSTKGSWLSKDAGHEGLQLRPTGRSLLGSQGEGLQAAEEQPSLYLLTFLTGLFLSGACKLNFCSFTQLKPEKKNQSEHHHNFSHRIIPCVSWSKEHFLLCYLKTTELSSVVWS